MKFNKNLKNIKVLQYLQYLFFYLKMASSSDQLCYNGVAVSLECVGIQVRK